MKTLKVYRSKMEGEMATQFLNAQGIVAELRGAKEYVAHYTGADIGRYELLVPADLHTQAQTHLTSVEQTANSSPTTISAGGFLRRAIFSAIVASIILPILFNAISLYNLGLYRNTESDSQKKTWYTVMVVALQLPAVGLIWLITKSISAP